VARLPAIQSRESSLELELAPAASCARHKREETVARPTKPPQTSHFRPARLPASHPHESFHPCYCYEPAFFLKSIGGLNRNYSSEGSRCHASPSEAAGTVPRGEFTPEVHTELPSSSRRLPRCLEFVTARISFDAYHAEYCQCQARIGKVRGGGSKGSYLQCGFFADLPVLVCRCCYGGVGQMELSPSRRSETGPDPEFT